MHACTGYLLYVCYCDTHNFFSEVERPTKCDTKMAETITNQAVNLDIESGDNINQICETVEANSDRRLNDDKDADQKELIPRDYQVAVIFIMLKWFQIYVS